MVAKSPVKGTTRRFVVEGSLCTLNEYTRLTRANKQASAALKRKQEEIVGWAIKQYLGNWHTDKPIRVRFLWIEKNKRKHHPKCCHSDITKHPPNVKIQEQIFKAL